MNVTALSELSEALRTSKRVFWCNVHQREARAIRVNTGEVRCDPKLSGIMIPCAVVELTGIAEIEKTKT